MSVLDFMQKFKLIDWYTLLVGLKHKWCNKELLIHYGEEMIKQTKSKEIDSNLAIIASGESLSPDDLVTIILKFLSDNKKTMKHKEESEALEKWRFAHLYWLLQKDGPEQEKIDILQELYAQFGFPEDMVSCSIYSQDTIAPLTAAENVVKKLSKQLHLELNNNIN